LTSNSSELDGKRIKMPLLSIHKSAALTQPFGLFGLFDADQARRLFELDPLAGSVGLWIPPSLWAWPPSPGSRPLCETTAAVPA
jgi:hypothetical protein